MAAILPTTGTDGGREGAGSRTDSRASAKKKAVRRGRRRARAQAAAGHSTGALADAPTQTGKAGPQRETGKGTTGRSATAAGPRPLLSRRQTPTAAVGARGKPPRGGRAGRAVAANEAAGETARPSLTLRWMAARGVPARPCQRQRQHLGLHLAPSPSAVAKILRPLLELKWVGRPLQVLLAARC